MSEEVKKDIEQRLKKGIKPVELIQSGFKKSTVYKVARELASEGHKSLEAQYRVVRLARVCNDVEMVLHEQPKIIDIPPPPSAEPAEETPPQFDMSRVIEPNPPKTDEERMAKRMIDGIKKYAPNLFPQGGGIAIGPAPKSLIDLTMILSLEDYKKLGSPAIEEVITVKLSILKEE